MSHGRASFSSHKIIYEPRAEPTLANSLAAMCSSMSSAPAGGQLTAAVSAVPPSRRAAPLVPVGRTPPPEGAPSAAAVPPRLRTAPCGARVRRDRAAASAGPALAGGRAPTCRVQLRYRTPVRCWDTPGSRRGSPGSRRGSQADFSGNLETLSCPVAPTG